MKKQFSVEDVKAVASGILDVYIDSYQGDNRPDHICICCLEYSRKTPDDIEHRPYCPSTIAKRLLEECDS